MDGSIRAELTQTEGPRITAAGVTSADVRERLEHNICVRDLASEVNQPVARIRQLVLGLSSKRLRQRRPRCQSLPIDFVQTLDLGI